MSILFEDSQSYWNNKLSTYLHDPFDKAFMIQGHEERARVLLEALGVQKPNDEFWRKADGIAAGLERGQLPSHSKDQSKNGAVDFLKDPVISHPTGGSNEKSSNTTQLRIKLPEQILSVKNSEDAEELTREIAEYIHTLLGRQPGDTGYSNQDIFRSKLGTSEGADLFAQARFLYTHLVLRFKLAQDDVIGLGGLWHRLPADTRFPDHSIWQHNALTSALYSAGEIAGSVQENVGLMVFSLTPVQSFIAKARKLRDYWTGSILLSWLAFEGILWIVENLGPDHIVYPSLIDQPLMNRYLEQEWDIQAGLNTDSDIASFPNKFVAVVPLNKLDEIKLGVSTRINDKWKEITEIGRDFLLNKSDPHKVDPEHLKTLFSRQTETTGK
ncbi:MAG TPA: type III-B CRISPR-associated protein Cas10/Cmr2 [Sediminispirochaeta sp.]|nr:type III-B CRISPR-associated protein Cas10/Cmr2 [Sediminispirochaeta sp.]